MPGTRLGNNVKVQNNVSIYEGVVLEDDVFCGPSCVFTNVSNPRAHVSRRHEFRQTLVRRGASIGANATIVCGITLGEYSFIGAGAVVTSDVPPYALMVGVPARRVGWMCRCGERLQVRDKSARCGACGTAYREDQGGLSVIDRPQTQG
jgi:UDP-2-acetamido-3-amino-2,3-dideoxy-glucuronate N-acetyltransferase